MQESVIRKGIGSHQSVTVNTKKTIYLISYDGYGDSIMMDRYATNESEILTLVRDYQIDMMHRVVSIDIDYHKMKIKVKYLNNINGDEDLEYLQMHLHAIKPI